jgi:hypothetical protein
MLYTLKKMFTNDAHFYNYNIVIAIKRNCYYVITYFL